jgi:hypothetical protein
VIFTSPPSVATGLSRLGFTAVNRTGNHVVREVTDSAEHALIRNDSAACEPESLHHRLRELKWDLAEMLAAFGGFDPHGAAT